MTKRNGTLSISVKGRIRFTTDLHAAYAVLHTACDSPFRAVKICLKSTVKTSLRLLLENILTSTNKDLKVFDFLNSIKRGAFASFIQ